MTPTASTTLARRSPPATIVTERCGGLASSPAATAAAWFAGRRSPGTRRAYASDMAQLGRFLLDDAHAPAELAHARAAGAAAGDLPAWRDQLVGRGVAPATVARMLSAARSFFRYLRAAGFRPDDPAAGVEVPRVSPELQHAPAVEASDVRSLLRVAASGRYAPRELRNTAALRLLAGLGLRCGELVELRRSDFDPGRRTVRVRGKGGKVRTLDTGPRLADQLGQLVAQLDDAGRIFPVSTRRVRQLLAAWRCRAGVADATPHALRRTYATIALDRGIPLETLRRSMGHTDPRTTARYDRRREASAIVEYD